ncbi:MAG TPA: M13 family metallopeptidase [Acidisarcina sp.]|nr:M13 family metallopeptidase [Acidisarcina sp.]
MHKRGITQVLAVAALGASCMAQMTQSTPVYKPIPGFDKSAMDLTADPCKDFYQYACGNFATQHPIPNDRPSFGQFDNLYEINTQALHGILEKAAAGGAERSANDQKIGDYYASCVDTASIETKGLAPIQPELDRIDALKSKDELPDQIARLQKIQVAAFLDFGSQQDFKDATRQIAVVDQSGLGLPEKDYYLRTDAKSEELRKQYVQHLTNLLKLLGVPAAKAEAEAQSVMKMETALAKVSMGNVARRDPENVYHLMPLTALKASEPGLGWDRFLKGVGSPVISEMNVTSPEFFKGLDQTLASTNIETIQTYLKLRLIDSLAMRLPKAFDEESFDFHGRKLMGTPEQSVRWKRCVSATDAAMGEVLGQVYVQQYFSPDQKAKTLQMVHDIEAQMGRDLDSLDWMSAATRAKAKEKLQQVADKIGYPDKWRDYSGLEIKRDDALGNSLRARSFEVAFQLAKIGKPVNRGQWDMSPPTVNAYYNSSMNDINFPAGILQPAFYDKNASDATNYGHIGAVVGHELTHGFDDQGRKFDGKGNLSDWWTAADAKNFEERTNCLVEEYGNFTAVDDVKVNGKLTLGENTADNGGLRLAIMALMARAQQSAIDMKQKTDGYDPLQQLFLGWAQNWCSNERPEMLRMMAQVDTHSPDRTRANGVVVNMPEFGAAFGCRKGAPMTPVKQCRVW